MTIWDRVEAVRKTAGFSGDGTVPDHAFTVQQYAEHYHLTVGSAEAQLDALVKAKFLEVGQKLGECKDGRKKLLKHYWPAEKKTEKKK